MRPVLFQIDVGEASVGYVRQGNTITNAIVENGTTNGKRPFLVSRPLPIQAEVMAALSGEFLVTDDIVVDVNEIEE